MKAFIYPLMALMLLPIAIMAQYPETDHFTSLEGTDEWTSIYSQSNAGIHSSTDLCFNVTGSYNNNDYYSFESTKSYDFSSDDCDSIKVTWNQTSDIRNGDEFLFCYYNSGWTCYDMSNLTGTYTIDLPASTTKFSFDLDTYNGSGNTSGKYTHVDYIEVDCYSTPLPVSLLYFNVKAHRDYNEISWATAIEVNNDHFTVIRKENGNYVGSSREWNVDGQGNSEVIKYYRVIDYDISEPETHYKLSQKDFDGTTNQLHIGIAFRTVEERRELYRINVLGQRVSKETKGPIMVIYSDGFAERLFLR